MKNILACPNIMATDNELKLPYAIKTISAHTILAFIGGRCTLNFSLAIGTLFTCELWDVIWIQLLLNSPIVD